MPLTLAKKLRLQLEDEVYVINRPSNEYLVGFKCIDEIPSTPVKTIILFVKEEAQLVKEVRFIVEKDLLLFGGRLLIAYPKKGNKKYDTYVNRDAIFPALQVQENGYIPNSQYKFNQMVKLDDDFTIVGLKKEENKTKKVGASQRVEDYVNFIPQVEEVLKQDNEALIIFQQLSPGYKKGWARYVFSAKKEETRKRRQQEMITLLKQGVKAIELKIK